jgi:hypothetical protein
MSRRPGRALLGLALLRSAQLGALLVGVVWLGSSVEAGDTALGLGTVLVLFGPVAFASGTAMAIAQLRTSGEWSAWEGLGYRPRRQLGGLVVLVLLGLVGQVVLATGLGGQVGSGGSTLELPAPVPGQAVSWPGRGSEEELGPGQLTRWQVAPARLNWSELQERRRARGPVGARLGVDRAESLRRLGWLAAWPLGLLWALLLGLRTPTSARDVSGPGPLGAAVLAGLCAVGWCLVVLVCSAALASVG